MKNTEWDRIYNEELSRLGWPRARALEALAASLHGNDEWRARHTTRRLIERQAQSNTSSRLTHKGAA